MSITPYAEKAAEYMMRGWEVLPLPERSKAAPPAGFTGAGGGEVTEELALGEWLEQGHNIALRLPKGVVGVDIDAYKDSGRTFTTLTRELGPLPETVGVSSQDSIEKGGTLFYTLPSDLPLSGGEGAVDLIQHHHRYSVAPPSVHPSGREYRWVSSSGLPLPWIPEPEDLSPLPSAWVERFAAVETPADLFEGVPFTTADGAPCKRMNSLLRGALIRLREKKVGRHDLMVKTTWALTAEAAKGHTGYERLLSAYRRAWEKTFTAEERATRPLLLEFNSAVRGAQRKVGKSAGNECFCETASRARATGTAGLRMFR